MSLPGHRRTSSHKRRRASHFALEKQPIVKEKKTGAAHLPHRIAPGMSEYNGHPVHVKGQKRKLEKLLKKSSTSSAKSEPKAAPNKGPVKGHEGHAH